MKIPVITAGGIGDARGVLAALALDAQAVYIGTRFMATKEPESHQNVKDAKGARALLEYSFTMLGQSPVG